MNSLIMSSANATKYSTTVKGLLIGILPVIMAVTGLTTEDAQSWIDVITNLVFFGTSLIATIQVIYGLARKIYLQKWSAVE